MPDKIETRGRKRIPTEQHKAPQATVKINEVILPLVKLLKSNLKKGSLTNAVIEDLTVLASNKKLPFKQTTVLDDKALIEQTEVVERLTADNLMLKAQYEQLKKASLDDRLEKQILKYDAEHLKVISLINELNKAKRELETLKKEIHRLNNLEHNCQCLTKNGNRCTRPAKDKAKWKGVELNVCLQHKKNIQFN
jgi:vacuolar-type H+-ATPase subunit I/STV1